MISKLNSLLYPRYIKNIQVYIVNLPERMKLNNRNNKKQKFLWEGSEDAKRDLMASNYRSPK